MILIPQVPLGESVPPNTKYAVSVSLPTWEDNVDYEKGDPRVVNCMVSGYPRFFIAMPIQALVANVKDRFALPNETAMLFPSQACADRCVQFIYDQAPKQQGANSYALPRQGQVRVVQHVVEPINKQAAALDTMGSVLKSAVTIYCVLFPEDLFPLAKQYWQHTGDGISARLADYCLNIARINEEYESATSPYTAVNGASVARRGSKSGYSRGSVAQGLPSVDAALEADTYLEERFGRNFDLKYAAEMKEALRRRIADAMGEHSRADGADAGASKAARLSSDDVYIVATGMSAVFHSHQALLKVRQGKSICFGFPYTDTLKILQKFGPGAYFLGHGEGDDYLELEQILERHHQENDPILAIFTECPSNPLLKTADLPRLRALANRYNAALVVDETLGSIAN
ncbi:Cystathionine gamma-synthase, partial [Linderina pennispora]